MEGLWLPACQIQLAARVSEWRGVSFLPPEPSPCPMRTSCLTASFLVVLAFLGCCAGCRKSATDVFQGYIEGEYVYALRPAAGHARAARSGARAMRWQGAAAPLRPRTRGRGRGGPGSRLPSRTKRNPGLQNLRKGKRPSEIASLEGSARRGQIPPRPRREPNSPAAGSWPRRASGAISEGGTRPLRRRKSTPTRRRSRDSPPTWKPRASARARTKSPRPRTRSAARRAIARAGRWALRQKTVLSPAGGVVHDTLYRAGRMGGGGQAGRGAAALRKTSRCASSCRSRSSPAIRVGQKSRIRFDGAPRNYAGPCHLHLHPGGVHPARDLQRGEPREVRLHDRRASSRRRIARELEPGQPVEVLPELAAAVP